MYLLLSYQPEIFWHVKETVFPFTLIHQRFSFFSIFYEIFNCLMTYWHLLSISFYIVWTHVTYLFPWSSAFFIIHSPLITSFFATFRLSPNLIFPLVILHLEWEQSFLPISAFFHTLSLAFIPFIDLFWFLVRFF